MLVSFKSGGEGIRLFPEFFFGLDFRKEPMLVGGDLDLDGVLGRLLRLIRELKTCLLGDSDM